MSSNAMAVIEYLAANGPIESRLKETDAGDIVFFSHGAPTLIGIELSDEDFLGLLESLARDGRIGRTETVHAHDSSEYIVRFVAGKN